ncbi:DNA translocase FtsK [Aquirufa antheringensis]|jgi:S-DNA-T family DNA segregation ATPase FtsK/SpoIIIE|uniref:DNA translocase FtsK n=1 Tax=Aquirufa antheringensis TaxID=2516559 RepID=A0A4Q9BHB6_9BACT|nr:DNA translocase FtsK [Aquirufa antheringensis]MCZ2478101.1 DNA translocase FtsK [Aquirufa antheringensis]MCZ2484136.1 DNA translocase FtsK [Aquirufa antheringensis]TBH74648.1 DNA translocase FtsK [Aquirufa antheringensis]
MAKKISNTASTLQLNFEQDKPKRKMDGAVLYRIQLIIAAFLFLIGTLLLVSFGSSFFVGVSDQSEVERGVVDTIKGSDIPIKNFAGLLGAKIAHFFLFKTFGWSTLLLIPLFYLSALKVGFKKEIYSLERLSWQVLFYILWFSLLAGFFVFSLDLPHSIGGGVGYFVNEKLYQLLGYLSIFVIGFGGFVFLVLFYQLNPKKAVVAAPLAAEEEEEEEEESLFIDEDGPAVHVDNDDLETFRPIVPPVVEEIVPVVVAPVEIVPEPVVAEEKKEDDLDFTYKVADVADEVIEEEPTPVSREIKANDLVEQFGLYDPTADLPKYQFPTIDLLKEYDQKNQTSQVTMDELKANKEKIVETLLNYGIGIQKIEATIGPTVTLYEIVPKAGVRVSKITSLEDDLSLSLAAMGVRIIGQMPGKDTIGIEVANKNREMVPVRAVIGSEKFQKSTFDLPITLGKTISNEIFVADLAKMPHLLMAGATGQGKSVGLNMLLTSLIYKKHPATLKFVLVDPKKVELSLFNKLERHFLACLPDSAEAIITDTKKVVSTLNSLCKEMDLRYDKLKDAGCRNIKEYNQKFINRRLNPNEHDFMPYIVLVIDELADLMLTAGKEVEHPIARLAQLARAIGIHLVVATQRPSVNVITGTIKANFPARLSFKVMSKIDSRTILDAGGADQLVGMGDMLLSMGSEVIRLQCAFVDTPEVEDICDFIGNQQGYTSAYLLPEPDSEEMGGQDRGDFDPSDRDSFFDEAARLVVMHQQGSTSLIQRKLKLGYNRAGRLIDQLEAAGIVGSFGGSKAREVLVKSETELEEILKNL